MAQGNRNIVKRLRFLTEQAQQLDQLLQSENMIFTDFIHALIAAEFLKMQHSVPREIQIIHQTDVKKRHRKPEKTIQRPVPKFDPEFMRELGRIGNNINQIARALNFLSLGDPAKQRSFSFLDCLETLGNIQIDLHQHLEQIPEIKRSAQAVLRARERAIQVVSEVKDAD